MFQQFRWRAAKIRLILSAHELCRMEESFLCQTFYLLWHKSFVTHSHPKDRNGYCWNIFTRFLIWWFCTRKCFKGWNSMLIISSFFHFRKETAAFSCNKCKSFILRVLCDKDCQNILGCFGKVFSDAFNIFSLLYIYAETNLKTTASPRKNLKKLKLYLSKLISLTIQYLYEGDINWYLVCFNNFLFGIELSDSYALIYSFGDSVGVKLPSSGWFKFSPFFSYCIEWKLLCLDKEIEDKWYNLEFILIHLTYRQSGYNVFKLFTKCNLIECKYWLDKT